MLLRFCICDRITTDRVICEVSQWEGAKDEARESGRSSYRKGILYNAKQTHFILNTTRNLPEIYGSVENRLKWIRPKTKVHLRGSCSKLTDK